MVGRITNSNLSASQVNRLEDVSAFEKVRQAESTGTLDWFLAGNTKTSLPIDTDGATNFVGATPEAIASQVLAHIGA